MITELGQNCLGGNLAKKIEKKERSVKKTYSRDRPAFPESSCQKSPGSELN